MRKSQGRFKRKVEEVEKDAPEEPVEENNPTKKPKLAHKRGKKAENSETLPEKVVVVAVVPKKKSKRNAKDETVIAEDTANAKKATKSKKKQEEVPVVEPKEENDEEMEVESPKEKKTKESKTVNNDTMNSSYANSTVAEDQDDDEPAKKVSKFETTSMDLTLSAGFPDDWSKEERCLLLEQVQNQLPENDVKEYNKTLRKIIWEDVIVTGRSSEECRAEYHSILRKLRKLKTMTEVLVDAKKFVEEHSSKLSKPLAPNMQYYLAHRAKYSRTHADLNMLQLQSKLLHKFEKLSDEKKKKYVDKYEEEMKAFKNEKEKIKKAEVPPKHPMNPMKLYLEDMYKKNPEKPRNELFAEYQAKWYVLDDEVRYKYINKAIQMWNAYKVELAAYREKYPNHQSNYKIFLSGSDRKIIERILGKPVKPATSGYTLFSKDKQRQLLQYPFAERSARISAEWKALPEAEKEKYINQWKELDEIFKRDFKKFSEEHPELSFLDEELKPKKAKSQKMKSEASKEKGSEPELDVINEGDD